MIEVLGVLASIIVFISFTQNKEVRIRLINIIGAMLFVVYGIIIGAWSVALVNGGLIILHVYKLVKLKKYPTR